MGFNIDEDLTDVNAYNSLPLLILLPCFFCDTCCWDDVTVDHREMETLDQRPYNTT